jgi:hypothetical protein
MRTLIGMALASPLLLGLGFAQGSSPALGSIRGDVFTKGTNGEPAVLPGARIVLRGPITKETESDPQGAFGIGGLPPGSYEIEANAPDLYAALEVEVSADFRDRLHDLFLPLKSQYHEHVIYPALRNRYCHVVCDCRLQDGTSSAGPVEMNVAAVTCTMSPQLTRLKAMDCAFSRKVHHA